MDMSDVRLGTFPMNFPRSSSMDFEFVCACACVCVCAVTFVFSKGQSADLL